MEAAWEMSAQKLAKFDEPLCNVSMEGIGGGGSCVFGARARGDVYQFLSITFNMPFAVC